MIEKRGGREIDRGGRRDDNPRRREKIKSTQIKKRKKFGRR